MSVIIKSGNTADLASVKPASTAAVATDPALVVAISPNNSLGVSGTVTANAGTNLNTSALNLETTQTAMSAKLPATLGQKAMAASMAVAIASDQASIPVASTLSAETTKVIGTVNISAAQSITANAGTNLNTSALALDATLTGGTQKTQINNGANTAAVKAASTAAVATDPALVVAMSPNSALALDATLTGGTQQSKITDGTNVASVKAASTAAVAADKALVTAISPNTASTLADGAGLNGLGMSMIATNFVAGTGNTTVAQLASGATYTGTVENVYSQQAISLLVISDQPGTLTVNQYIDAAGTKKAATVAFNIAAGVGFSRSFVANGNYFNLSFKNTGLATTTTLSIDTAYGTLPASSNRGNSQVSIDEVNAVQLFARPDGFMNVRQDPTGLLFDTFETYDTTNTWTAFGTAPTASGGNLVFNQGTAANATSYTRSQAAFTPTSSAYLQVGILVQLEAATLTGATRWWGLGIPAGSPSTGVPIANGSVFELRAADGLLYGSVYSNSVLTQSVALVRPTDATTHRYQITYKGSRVYFNIDNVEVGSLAFPNPVVGSLALTAGVINGGSVLGTAAVLNVSLMGVGDTARNNQVISDGVFPWRKATVKAASTAPVATDPALVVSISPNTVTTGPADVTATGALGALNAAVQLTMSGLTGAGFQLAAGTLIGTLIPEVSYDGGTTWNATLFDDPVTGNKAGTIVFAGSNAATARSIVGAGGAGLIRVRVSAFTSGTANITLRASQIRDPSLMSAGAAGSTPLPPVVLQVGGSDGTNLRALSTVPGTGQVVVSQVDGYKATYSATVVNLAAVGTTPTDIFTITGSATKTVRINRVTITASQTTAAQRDVLLIKRSTANSAGTSAAVTAVPHDSNNAAATATVLSYTANPTLGTTVGTVSSRKVFVATTTANSDEMITDFGVRNDQAVVLRGIAQVFAVNLNSVASAGNLWNIRVEWTEE